MISDFLRERSARAESESFTLDKLRHRGRLKLLDTLRRRACALLFAEDLDAVSPLDYSAGP